MRKHLLVVAAITFGLTFVVTYYQFALDPLHSALAAAGGAVAVFGLGGFHDDDDKSVAILLAAAGAVITGSAILHGLTGPLPPATGGDSKASSIPLSGPSAPTPTRPSQSPGGSLSPTSTEEVAYDVLLGPKYSARGAPIVSAHVVDGPKGSQRLVIEASDLGLSSIGIDLYDPSGNTVLGVSRGSVDRMVFTYDLFPQVSGTYEIRVTDKDSGDVGIETVELTANPGTTIVREFDGSVQPRIEVWAEGSACQPNGARIMAKTYGAPDLGTVYITFPSGDYVNAGLAVDSVGTDYVALGLRSSRCTNELVSGIDFALLTQSGQSLATASLAVENN